MLEFLLLFVLFYYWHMFGITIGYHRLLSHRSFTCPKFIEYFFVLSGYLGFQSSPIWWSTIHRAHHRHSDTPLDPHSPRYGMARAHLGWIFQSSYPDHIDPIKQAPDLTRDPLYRALDMGGHPNAAHLLNSVIGFGFRVLLLVAFGWKVALASTLAGLAAQQLPFLLNVVCHMPALGYQNGLSKDDSVNIWWVAILTAGEGWHNNHHVEPGSAKSGVKKHEIDASWIVISMLAATGLASVRKSKRSAATT